MARPPKPPKIRLGDRVVHVKRPNLGTGTVWELRHSRVSVHWDNVPSVPAPKAVGAGVIVPGPDRANYYHYRFESLKHAN